LEGSCFFDHLGAAFAMQALNGDEHSIKTTVQHMLVTRNNMKPPPNNKHVLKPLVCVLGLCFWAGVAAPSLSAGIPTDCALEEENHECSVVISFFAHHM
jgi:hypothetical protein